jgi:hypothetical protein
MAILCDKKKITLEQHVNGVIFYNGALSTGGQRILKSNPGKLQTILLPTPMVTSKTPKLSQVAT